MVKATGTRKGRKIRSSTGAGTTVGREGRRAGGGAKSKARDTKRRGPAKRDEKGCNGAGPRRRMGFAGLSKSEGCAALVVVAERAGRERDQVSNECAIGAGGGQGRKVSTGKVGGQGQATRRVGRVSLSTCRALAAVGHVVRVRLLSKLLEGPATYRALQRLTKLKPGPLYHHVNQLRLTGLIRPKQRDLYELTRGGRNLILTIVAVAPLIRDSRRRPLAVGKG